MPDPTGTDDRAATPEPLARRIKDAAGWGVAVVISNFANLGHTWRSASPRERFRLAVAVLRLVAGVIMAVAVGLPWLVFALTALLATEAIADLDDIATAVAERQKTLRLLSTKPTGAPRVAEILCSRGVSHRFLYGPGGWEEAGPAQHAVNA